MNTTKRKFLLDALSSTMFSSETSEEESTDTDDDEAELKLVLEGIPISRIENFIERTVANYTDEIFQSHFRISRRIVYVLVARLEASGCIPIHDDGREKITSEKAFLLALWYLSNTEMFRQVSDRFGVSLSSAHRTLMRVLDFLLSLRTEFIKWPTVPEYEEISAAFKAKQNIENVIGAIDGCHVRIRRPVKHEEVYVNRNKYHSVLIQGIVDHRKRFIDVYCGEPGSIHDARLLRKSGIYSKNQENANFLGNYFLLGDSAYPSLRWLVPPFKDNGALSANQRLFNFKHSSCRIVVAHTFGLLKGGFRRLQHIDNLDINTTVKIVMVCCVLHNICEIHKDDTFIESFDVSDQVNAVPEAWADYIVFNSRREEVFSKMFP